VTLAIIIQFLHHGNHRHEHQQNHDDRHDFLPLLRQPRDVGARLPDIAFELELVALKREQPVVRKKPTLGERR